MLTPVPAEGNGSPAATQASATQVALDPSVVLLVCEQDCVDDVMQRAGASDANVEVQVGDGGWTPARGAIVPIGSAAVPVQFRVTPANGEPVIFGAEFVGSGSSISQGITVQSSGEVADSDGVAISSIPVFEAVADDGFSLSPIIGGIVALLVLVLVLTFLMQKRKQRLSRVTDDSSSKV
jgi:hypothetical protein